MHWTHSILVAVVGLVTACNGLKQSGDEGSTGTGEEGGDGECQDEDWGTVMIELQRSAGQATDPFAGTASIVVFLDYEASCLAPFFVDNPTYQIDGVEGAPVFEAWRDGCLCDPTGYDVPIIACADPVYNQVIDTQGAQDITRLIIDYPVQSDDLEGLQIPFGPLPTESLAGCTPLVKLSGASVRGEDGDGNCVWQIASFENPSARVGQGAAIQIFVESC